MSGKTRFGILGAYPPTPGGLANFSASLSDALRARGSEVDVVRVADDAPSTGAGVVGELVNGSADSAANCVELLNQADVAVVQHEYGFYGGTHGDDLLEIIDRLRVPAVAVAHTILKNPAPHQRWVMERVAAMTAKIVVMSRAAQERLCGEYGVDRHKVVVIPHGAVLPKGPRAKRGSRPIILTFGMMGPGKGVERVIDVMASLQSVAGRPRYLVAGKTRPEVLARDGEAYREALLEQARRNGVADSVSFDDRYLDRASLAALLQSAAVIVLPYDSTDQVTSAALVDAIASGRPIVATAFPHAVEMLRDGAGILVPHDDPDAMAAALRSVLTQPRLAGTMAAEARQLAPSMAWPLVADGYAQLATRLLAERRARV
ncbi:glycosyltransferase [Mycolicibacterium vaccae]|uniref:Group 1 glycosyl transferase n=1 Tax=Mycolicibacterium vaccae ATCC 25954 TaxID=1194972 RepID=K0UYM9_MYCVA|nr:glycosyltransferase [Mycolicibacterium vaccae]ANI38071.1 glycosyl transferase family 1 [Mycolicibacterium vaccae 95051]EJZ12247.1 group 1 glycosyl transferase [Mycolicibacterium vaccae ATCC 25954]MCV7061117.1 glycosyltransferase [Mycolicibacterium vaccae]